MPHGHDPAHLHATPPLSTNQGLTAKELAAFQAQGFLHVPGVISAQELTVLRRAADALVAPARSGHVRNSDYAYAQDEVHGRVLFRINQMLLKGPEFLQLWGHPRLLGIAESVQGPELLPVALAMVMKTPGCGMAVPWHRDPAFCTRAWGTNLGIYLDDADEENGMLHVIPGSHTKRCFDLAQAVSTHGFDLPGSLAVPVRAGDVIMHSENVLHGSRQVGSQRERRVLYFGVRSITEQLSKRSLDPDWVRAYARILQHAIHSRRLGIGAQETPFTWHASDPRYQQPLEPGAYVELRIEGGDSHGDPKEALGFTDDIDQATGRGLVAAHAGL